ncbi:MULTISPECIES: SulP family inorganic anion transporter [unclassified Amycolatopsis]|uniref:SulP family inorganic anion transporter n=1 Tax=unclassified Amycolatopsis TaxID=2618356 RepID=UPI001C6A6400|nr:sulfate permease [Amycolatopsis sp. DSM 110486]QYN20288.1 sulfate permease [Amycolatopsis sp. DSM 110486]
MKLSAVLPGLARLRRYQRTWLRGDVVAGVTVAAYLVPQVMAYAEVAGLPPVAGLWAAIGPLAVYALLGSSSLLSVGPESTTALMTAAVLAPFAAGDPGHYATLAAVLAVLVGGLCLVAAFARLGVLAELLSKPVLTGYMVGIAVLMVVGQLSNVTGVPVDRDGFAGELSSFFSELGQVHWPTVGLAAAVLFVLLVLRRVAPWLPGPLVAIAGATAVVAFAGLPGIEVVGALPAGLPPALSGFSLAEVGQLVLPALGITIVAFSDNVLTARAFAAGRGEEIDANQELRALAGVNVSSGLLHGFPVSSSGSRTALGSAAGSRTQLYSLVALGTVVLIVLFARPLLAQFPTAALGALVIFAATYLVDIGELRRFARFRRSELLLALLTTAGVLGLGVIYGVLAAVGLSVLDLLRRIARPHDGILGMVPGLAGMHDVDDYPEAAMEPGLVVYRYDAPLCFANAEDFRRRALAAASGEISGPVRWFVLNTEANVELDVTAADALDQLREELTRRGVVFALARVKQDLRDDLEAAGLVERVGEERIFPTLPTAVGGYRDWLTARG